MLVNNVPSVEYLHLIKQAEDFLYLEADLLDERKFEQWLDLLADDIRYRVPLRKNLRFSESHRDISDEDDMSWMDDDKETLVKRVTQIMTGLHWAEEPLSRVTHMVTNVRIENVEEVIEGATEWAISNRILVHRSRLDTETDYFIGRRKDVLRVTAQGFQLARRTVILDQTTLLAKNLTIFL